MTTATRIAGDTDFDESGRPYFHLWCLDCNDDHEFYSMAEAEDWQSAHTCEPYYLIVPAHIEWVAIAAPSGGYLLWCRECYGPTKNAETAHEAETWAAEHTCGDAR